MESKPSGFGELFSVRWSAGVVAFFNYCAARAISIVIVTVVAIAGDSRCHYLLFGRAQWLEKLVVLLLLGWIDDDIFASK